MTYGPLRRGLAMLATAMVAPCLLVVVAAPARAEASTMCPQSTSTRVVTVDDGAGNPVDKLWITQPTPQQVVICYVASGVVAGAVQFGTGLTGSLVPTVTPVLNDSACPVFLHVTDPVDLVTRLAATTSVPYYLCFGFGSTAVGVTVTAAAGTPAPSARLWIDRHTVAGDLWCTVVAPQEYDCGGSAIRIL